GTHEMPDLVLNRGDGFQLELDWHGGEFLLPKGTNDRIAELGDQWLAKLGIAQNAQQAEERRSRRFEERQKRVSQDMFHPRSPEFAVEFLEGRDDAGGDERSLFGSWTGEK